MLLYRCFEPANDFLECLPNFFLLGKYLLRYADEFNWTSDSYLQQSYLLSLKDLREGFRNSGSICGSSDAQQCSSEGSEP